MKKIVILLLVLVLLAAMMQVAFANPDPPNSPPTDGSCNMSWWAHLDETGNWVPDEGPGKHNGVEDGDRGMYHVHFKDNPEWYTNGAINMDAITKAHCG